MLCVQQVLARLCKIQMRDSMPPPAQVDDGKGDARSHELKKHGGESTVKKKIAQYPNLVFVRTTPILTCWSDQNVLC